MKQPEPAVSSGKAGPTAYTVQGQGAPVVLVHGVGMAREVWQPQVDGLAGDHRVVTYDLLGHGASDDAPEGVALDAYADQLVALLDHLDIAAAHVVGHSMGALIALEFALSHPERVLRVVPMNAVFERTPEQRAAVEERAAMLDREGAAATVGPTLDRWFGTPPPDHLRAAAALVEGLLRNVHPQGYARTYRVFARSDRVHAQRLPSLAVPALFFTAEFDANSSPAMSAAMARLVPGSQLEVLEGARHMMGVTHPQQVNAVLRSFLDGPAR